MTARQVIRIVGSLVARAGRAPILVFLLHVFISRVLNGYILYPPLDIPMHFFGGVAMAYFLSKSFSAVPEGAIAPPYRPFAEFVFVVSVTATASIVWEFAEFTSDFMFGTRAQLGLDDTLFDMALGIAGGLSYAVMSWRQGTLGVVAPVYVNETRE